MIGDAQMTRAVQGAVLGAGTRVEAALGGCGRDAGGKVGEVRRGDREPLVLLRGLHLWAHGCPLLRSDSANHR